MIDKELLQKNILNCLLADGMVEEGLAFRKQMQQLSILAEYDRLHEWKTRLDALVDTLCRVVANLEAAGR